ncbi:MAG: 6-bladed beta-propeller, partial [Deltaproteobacteria bacterium]|nr:6-bladed beta-propeller [Deltaproteobacteria bacterium]
MVIRFFYRAAYFAVLLSALVGCAPSASSVIWKTEGVDWVYPEPPAQPRIRFLKQISGLKDLRDKDDAGQRWLKWLGGEETVPLPMVSPYGVAADGKGRIWVSDPGSGLVHVIDLARKRIDYLSVINGRKLLSPVGAVYNSRLKRLYISDTGLREVLMFDADNRYLGSLKPKTGFGRPAGMAIDAAGNLYVADALAGIVDVFSAAGEYRKSLGSRIAADGKFNRPSNLALDAQGRIYVVDSLRFRVEILGLADEPPMLIGGLGDVAGSFARPRGIALDSAGHIYVSDAAFDNIQVFNRRGDLLLVLGRG